MSNPFEKLSPREKTHTANDHTPEPDVTTSLLGRSMCGTCRVCGRGIVRDDIRNGWKHGGGWILRKPDYTLSARP